MRRRTETGHRSLADRALGTTALRAGLLLAVALACRDQAPEVHSEPSAPSRSEPSAPSHSEPAAPSRSEPAAPSHSELAAPSAPSAAAAPEADAPGARVGLAKFAEAAAPAPPAPQPAPAADGPAAKPAPGAQPVQGKVVKDEPFSVWLQAKSPVAAGSDTTVEAVLVANAPYHCNAEYPHKFKLGAPPAGLSYPETTVKGMQVSPERSVLAIPVRAQSPGKATVSGTLSFSVCDDERCLIEKRELALDLEVK